MKRTEIKRKTPLKANADATRAWQDRSRRTSTLSGSTLGRGPGPKRKVRLPPVSKKRKAENKVRRANCLAAFGTDPACARCGAPAVDAHEVIPRSKGGSITDTANIRPVCRACHDFLHAHPLQAKAEGFLA